jgi:glycosyltransferase involved in cell wall biosynthesis
MSASSPRAKPAAVDPRRVSFVVPTRNSERTIQACLAPLRDQTHNNVEVIVVDNFSTDSTRPIAEGLADQVLIAGPERSAQRNIGAAAATGGILVFLDSDMRAPMNLAHEIVRGLDRLPMPDALVLPEISVGEGYWARCKRLEKLVYLGDSAVEAARAFRAGSFWAVGGFDEELPPGTEDWDLSDRIREVGASIARASVRVTHDEGHLSLLLDLRKKYYYGRSVGSYFRKRPDQVVPKLVRTAFMRKGRLLVNHPMLTAGLFVMKCLELGAVAAGAVTSGAVSKRRAPLDHADRAPL